MSVLELAGEPAILQDGITEHPLAQVTSARLGYISGDGRLALGCFCVWRALENHRSRTKNLIAKLTGSNI